MRPARGGTEPLSRERSSSSSSSSNINSRAATAPRVRRWLRRPSRCTAVAGTTAAAALLALIALLALPIRSPSSPLSASAPTQHHLGRREGPPPPLGSLPPTAAAGAAHQAQRATPVFGELASAHDTATLASARDARLAPSADRPLSSDEPQQLPPPSDFLLLRTLGNSLPPRHAPDQTLRNLEFLLAHEQLGAFPPSPTLGRFWLLNRLVDRRLEAELVSRLREHGEAFAILPFRLSEYAQQPNRWDDLPEPGFLHRQGSADTRRLARLFVLSHKINYATNTNAARNFLINLGIRAGARWILPWDGNCFLTPPAFAALAAAAAAAGPHTRYLTVPMQRLATSNEALLLRSPPLQHSRAPPPPAPGHGAPAASAPAPAPAAATADLELDSGPASSSESNLPGPPPLALDEPQVVFRFDALARFDERLPYGRRSKTALLQTLLVPGPWWDWKWEAWEAALDPRLRPTSDVAGWDSVPAAGWVVRLDSGRRDLEERNASATRTSARNAALLALVGRLDAEAFLAANTNHSRSVEASRVITHQEASTALDSRARPALNCGTCPLFFDEAQLAREQQLLAAAAAASSNGSVLSANSSLPTDLMRLAAKLDVLAEKARQLPPFSVADKQALPASGCENDFYSVAPHYWPPAAPSIPVVDNTTSATTPAASSVYQHRDAELPEAGLYTPGSERFDHSRLVAFAGNLSALTLAGLLGGAEREHSLQQAARLVHHWFLHPRHRMRPHLRFAHVRRGWFYNRGTTMGLIEGRVLVGVAESVRLLARAGALTPMAMLDLRLWFADYTEFLLSSRQGRTASEHPGAGSLGAWLDAQLFASAALAGNLSVALRVAQEAESRLAAHFPPDGSTPLWRLPVNCAELEQASTDTLSAAHAWLSLARLLRAAGVDLWTSTTRWHAAPPLCPALAALLPWVQPALRSCSPTLTRPYLAIFHAVRLHCPASMVLAPPAKISLSRYDAPYTAFPHHHLFWNLGLV